MRLSEQLSNLVRIERHPRAVKETLQTILHDARHHIENLVQDKDKKPCWARAAASLSAKFVVKPDPRRMEKIIECFEQAKLDYYECEVDQHMLDLLDMPDVEWSEEWCQVVKDAVRLTPPDGHMQQTVNEACLSIVRGQYWQQIDNGDFIAGTNDAEMLLSSVSYAFKYTRRRLADFSYLRNYLQLVHKEELLPTEKRLSAQVALESDALSKRRRTSASSISQGRIAAASSNGSPGDALRDATAIMPHFMRMSIGSFQQHIEDIIKGPPTPWQVFLTDSAYFNMGIAIVIILNAVFIAIEQASRTPENHKHPVWIVLEVIFTAIFTAEFLIKVCVFRITFFFSGWNLFDFSLVVLGWVGLAMEVVVLSSQGVSSENLALEARLLRVNRVFRVLRIIRIFRLAKFIKLLRARLAKRDLSLQLAEHLQTITVLRAFVKAHIKSQEALRNYMGCATSFKTCEEARCLMESQTQMYQAVTFAAQHAQAVDRSRLRGMSRLRSNIGATSELTDFVMGAIKAGVITAREAECILHPLEEKMRTFFRRLQETHDGFEDELVEPMSPVGFPSNQPRDLLKPKEVWDVPLPGSIPIADFSGR